MVGPVGPAAKREAVAHLQAVMGLSERRACQFVSVDRTTVRYASKRPADTENCASGCATSPMRAAASATDGCSSCCARKASILARTGSTGFTARKGSRCAIPTSSADRLLLTSRLTA